MKLALLPGEDCRSIAQPRDARPVEIFTEARSPNCETDGSEQFLDTPFIRQPKVKAALCHHELDLKPVFHVFLNTVCGHEHLKQAAALAKALGLPLSVYVPTAMEFLLYIGHTVITVPLGPQYLRGRRTTHQRIEQLTSPFDIDLQYYEPNSYTGGVIPDIGEQWSVMTCPRFVSSGLIHDRYHGPSVGQIIGHAPFPLFVPSSRAVEWTSVSVMFDESVSSGKALGVGVEIALHTEKRFSVYEMFEREPHRADDVASLIDEDLKSRGCPSPQLGHSESASENELISQLNMDSLVVVGVRRPRRWWQTSRQNPLEEITDAIPNPLLIVGEKCCVPNFVFESPHRRSN